MRGRAGREGFVCPRDVARRGTQMNEVDRAGALRRARRGQSVLIVGAGSLGRFTGEAIKLDGRHDLIGYLQLPSERVASRLPAPILGSSPELEACLRGHAL